MTWTALFERAAAYSVTEREIRSALTAHRDE